MKEGTNDKEKKDNNIVVYADFDNSFFLAQVSRSFLKSLTF